MSAFVLPTRPLPPLTRGATVLSYLEFCLKTKLKDFGFLCKFICLCFFPPFQSLEPLPASGPDFGALGEEAEFVEVEPEAKQEILENKDVSILLKGLIVVATRYIHFREH